MPWPLVIFRLVFAVAMLVWPGYLIARLARMKAAFALAYPLSALVLFCVVFWMHACGFALTFGHIAVPEFVICAALAIYLKRSPSPLVQQDAESAPWRRTDKICIGFVSLMVVVLAWRVTMVPLAGFDTFFRWNFLAQQILKFHRYDFYPPLAPADFQKYFYVDAIPPLVSFTYWWLYSAAGSDWSRLSAVPIVLQYISALLFVFEIARHLGGLRAGTTAAAALASSPLFFHNVGIGQETGLTAVGVLGILYASCLYGENFSGCAIAGAMAALAALSREYGWGFLIIGVVCLLPLSKKRAGVFLLAAFALAGPWYVRTWWLTGNPFYSIPFFKINVNPVIGALLLFCRRTQAINQWTLAGWFDMAAYLFETAILQWTLGVIGLFVLLSSRRQARQVAAIWIATIVGIAIWLYSVGNTGGGQWYSTRVLTPALAALSISAGVAWAQTRYAALASIVVVYACVGALLTGWIYPIEPSALSLQKWFIAGASSWIRAHGSEHLAPRLAQAGFPRSNQILSSDSYLYVGLLPDGYSVTPPWRPDLSFLFDPKISPDEDCRRLIAMHITAVEFDPDALNTVFLDSISTYFHQLYHDPRGYQPLLQIGNGGILLLPGAKK